MMASVLFIAAALISSRALTGDELLKIGDLHEVQNHFHEALSYYERAVVAFRAKRQADGEASALLKVAGIYERQGKLRDAYTAVTEAAALLPKIREARRRGAIVLDASKIAKEGVALSRANPDPGVEADFRRLLAVLEQEPSRKSR